LIQKKGVEERETQNAQKAKTTYAIEIEALNRRRKREIESKSVWHVAWVFGE